MDLDAESLVQSAKRDALAALAPEEVAHRMAARRCERQIRDAILRQLPDSKSIQQATSPIIDVQVPLGHADEVARFQCLLEERDFDALVARYPLRETRALGAITKALKCASTRDYEQMVAVRTAKDEALAAALKSRVRPLAEAVNAAAVAS